MQLEWALLKGYLEYCDDTELNRGICCICISVLKATTTQQRATGSRQTSRTDQSNYYYLELLTFKKTQEWLPLCVSLSNPSDIQTWRMPFRICDYEPSHPNFKARGMWQSSKHEMMLDWATGHREQIRIACLWQAMSTVVFKTHTGMSAVCC